MPRIGETQKGGFQKGGFGGCSPGTKTGTRVRSDIPPERKTATRARSHVDSRESFAIQTPIFTARQADSSESLELQIRADHPIRVNRANRFARITPLSP